MIRGLPPGSPSLALEAGAVQLRLGRSSAQRRAAVDTASPCPTVRLLSYLRDSSRSQVKRHQLVDALTDDVQRTTEANIQSAVRDLLLHGGLDLAHGEVVNLEATSSGGRIDVEVGATVFEVKRDLSGAGAEDKALEQLHRYVEDRQGGAGGRRIVGVLTDGLRWSAWHLPIGNVDLQLIDRFSLAAGVGEQELDRLLVWLDGLMATKQQLPPSPKEVERRLGAESSATKLDLASLQALLQAARDHPDVRLKRELWKRLLTVASGSAVAETDDTKLFLDHTYLVVLAELIGHAIIGYDVAAEDPEELLRGRLFSRAGVYGVIEQDFFDWVGDVDGGLVWVSELARRVARFEWQDVEHDVLKILYESVIGRDTRHSLGEYYTPDWLVRAVVDEVVDDPVSQRVLDPACGSGTFLFWAVRQALDALESAGMSSKQAIDDVSTRVFGMDVHPVAVTLARITYLLAIGKRRLSHRGPFSVPVYLGDSVQFESAEGALWGGDGLIVHVVDDLQGTQPTLGVYEQSLSFPQRVIDDVGTFDQLISELTDLAANRAVSSKPPSIKRLLDHHGVHPNDQAMVVETFKTLCELNDDGRNHIWGYYLRNLARPRWLAQAQNRVDRIVGNPPWLSYRHMPVVMQDRFKRLAVERGLWAGGQVATQQDLSALFVVRSCELYLASGGRFGMVVPFATLSRQAYEGFRTGAWGRDNLRAVEYPRRAARLTATSHQGGASLVTAHLGMAWQLLDVTPDIFPVPSAVVFGTRAEGGRYTGMPSIALKWEGRQPEDPSSLGELVRTQVPLVRVPTKDEGWSPYHARFYQGAAVVPRALNCVERVPPGPLGVPEGLVQVRAARSTQEKPPWRDVKTLSGQVEERFVRTLHLGSTVLPFRLDKPWEAIVPWDGERILTTQDGRTHAWPGLAKWMAEAEQVWIEHRAKSAKNFTLHEWVDYQQKLTRQFGALHRPRVIYSTSGVALAAAVLNDPQAVVDDRLYWAAAASMDEARYLCAVLNAEVTTEQVRPLQSVGAFGPRHFHKWVWALPIPHYDSSQALHRHLVELAKRAELVAAEADIEATPYPDNRSVVRHALVSAGLMSELNAAVAALTMGIAREGGHRGGLEESTPSRASSANTENGVNGQRST
jgi:SAM-dependent methyltransferase